MTEAMPFLRKLILLSYDPRAADGEFFDIGEVWRRTFCLQKKKRV